MSGGQCVWLVRGTEMLAQRRCPWAEQGSVLCWGGGRCMTKTHWHQCGDPTLTLTHPLSAPNPPRGQTELERAWNWRDKVCGMTGNQGHANEMQTACKSATPHYTPAWGLFGLGLS